MKKLIVLTLTLLMIMSISVSAAPTGASLGDIPQTSVAINVDATKDEIYDKGLIIPLERPITVGQNDYGTKGTAWCLFNDGILYVVVNVKDSDIETPDPANQKSSPWSTESVEVFVDAGNKGEQANVLQYRIDVTGWPCVYTQAGRADYGQEAVGDAFDYACKLGSNEYWVEFAIPVEGAKTQGFQFGFQFQINDRSTKGDPQVQIMSPSSLGATSWTADTYDYAVVGEMIIEEEIIVEEATAPATEAATVAPAPTAPVKAAQTSDMTVIMAIGTLLTSGAAFIISKKRK